MPRFRCINKRCDQFGEEELVPHVKFKWNEEKKTLEAPEAECPSCSYQRETVKEPGPIAIPWFKPENAKNYNNKTIKKYDYDREAAHATTAKLPKA
jgi:hypothetical protein